MELKETLDYFAEKNDRCLSLEKNDFLYRGDRDKIFLSLIKTLSPFGKVAGVFSEKSYAENFKNVSALLSDINVSLFSVVVRDGEDEIEVAKTFASFPEDVRACIVFDRKKVRLAKYLSSVNGLPLIIYATTGSVRRCSWMPRGTGRWAFLPERNSAWEASPKTRRANRMLRIHPIMNGWA